MPAETPSNPAAASGNQGNQGVQGGQGAQGGEGGQGRPPGSSSSRSRSRSRSRSGSGSGANKPAGGSNRAPGSNQPGSDQANQRPGQRTQGGGGSGGSGGSGRGGSGRGGSGRGGGRSRGGRPAGNRPQGRPASANGGPGGVAAGTKPARARDLVAPVAVEPARNAKTTKAARSARAAASGGAASSPGPGSGLGRAVAIAGIPAVVLLVIVVAIGAGLGSPVIAVIVGVVLAGALWSAIWFGSTRLILSRLGGGSADEGDVPRAANLVDGLCATMGLPFPQLVLLDDPFRGALVLGRNEQTGTLVLTTGLLRALDPVELEGVLAHELSHVKSGDMVSATMAGAVVLPFAPLWSGSPELVRRLAGSGRELAADQRASSVTRYPPGLRDGLVKMAAGPPPVAPSTLASSGTGRVLRWLWTVVPELLSPPSIVGILDAPATRVAALDEA